MGTDQMIEDSTRIVEYAGVDTSIKAKILCYTDRVGLRKLNGFGGRSFGGIDPIIIRNMDGSCGAVNLIGRVAYDLVVIEAQTEDKILDLLDALEWALRKAYGPYERCGKPIVSVVDGHESFVRLLERTYEKYGIRFVNGSRRDCVIDVGLGNLTQ